MYITVKCAVIETTIAMSPVLSATFDNQSPIVEVGTLHTPFLR